MNQRRVTSRKDRLCSTSYCTSAWAEPGDTANGPAGPWLISNVRQSIMSEWFFFMSEAERRGALTRLLEENSVALVSGRLHSSKEVPRFVGLMPKEDVDVLFPNGVVYLLPPFRSELVVERVGDTRKFKISELKGGPHSRISLPRLYPTKSPPSLKPGVLSRNAEFWDFAIKQRTPASAEFKDWHESLKKTLQRHLKKIGRVWISAGALADVRQKKVLPVLAPQELQALLSEKKKEPNQTPEPTAPSGRGSS